ncbi:MAG: tetratricopeptide repeat protein, partial [Chloroflexi bacterium]|nr:tetratricopeptide repeat protein [Chloroflexota bacterium]
MAVARIFQRNGDNEKAAQAIERARPLEPTNADILRALDLLRRGAPLPEAEQRRGMTGPLRAAQAFVAPEAQTESAGPAAAAKHETTNSPIEPARQKALAVLAAYLFDEVAEEDRSGAGLGAITKGTTGALRAPKPSRASVIAHLGHAIDMQSRGDSDAAIYAYEKAVEAGLNNPAAHLCLGLLYLDTGVQKGAVEETKIKSAIKNLRAVVAHPEFKTGANFALGQALRLDGNSREAVGPLLEVLRDVDLTTVHPSKTEELSRLYEPIIEGQTRSDDAQTQTLAENLIGFLSGEGWEERVKAARRRLDAAGEDSGLGTLADLLSMPGTDRLLESMRLIDQYYEKGYLSSAMDECFRAVESVPTYLPVHLRMADILVKESRLEAAIAKYTTVAEAYRVRGDSARSARILEQVVRLAPMDLNVRTRLIDLLILQNKIDEAMSQFIDMAEAYYQLADLDGARQTFSDALRLAQRSSVDRAWSAQILHAMGDIDMQRLDWRQAVRVYQQIKTLAPSDEKARGLLIDLNLRLGNKPQALVEVDDLLRYRVQEGQIDQAISFLDELVRQRPEEAGLRHRLARLHAERGRKPEAIAQLDALGEMQLRAGQTAEAAETIRAILALGPGDPGGYRQLLAQLEKRSSE